MDCPAPEAGAAIFQPIVDALDAALISLDTTGLDALEQLHKALDKRGGHLSMTHLNEQPRSLLERSGFAAQLHPYTPEPPAGAAG